jgi:hypothetical protein
MYLDSIGMPSQFIVLKKVLDNFQKAQRGDDKAVRADRSMMTSIIKQISAKLKKDLYRLNMPFLKGETMVVGIDTV